MNLQLKNKIYLGVNVDHIATLREARGCNYPDPVQAVIDAELAGADGITLHLREDRRHINERDVRLIRKVLQTRMNFEMAVTDAMLAFAEEISPQHVCFVPEKREELTTEGGLDVIANFTVISEAVKRMQKNNSEVSLFIAPDIKQINAAFEAKATTIEIHTGNYANTVGENQAIELDKIRQAAEYAANLGLIVNGGHGLHYHNVQPIAAIDVFHELNIGHAIVARALFVGFKEAVSSMRQLMQEARNYAYTRSFGNTSDR
ncbi:MAG: pyridoxine 5'-phosphate synthase [Legionellales bacterium RIFCSPHIGHO2_12_FULL_35_11]|nr:MAG: pyridoxine 5'-phosphate synthase [Legionellales bacterium RIFCSPHIGHO2_12_FULL_35_11]